MVMTEKEALYFGGSSARRYKYRYLVHDVDGVRVRPEAVVHGHEGDGAGLAVQACQHHVC